MNQFILWASCGRRAIWNKLEHVRIRTHTHPNMHTYTHIYTLTHICILKFFGYCPRIHYLSKFLPIFYGTPNHSPYPIVGLLYPNTGECWNSVNINDRIHFEKKKHVYAICITIILLDRANRTYKILVTYPRTWFEIYLNAKTKDKLDADWQITRPNAN